MTKGLRRLAQSKTLRLAAKVFLTLGAFWYVLHGIDFDGLADILHHQRHRLLAAALALIVCQVALGALRWRLILLAIAERAPIMPTLEALKIYYISVFFNCCLPGTVGGDVVRVWLAKSDHVPLPLSINSVIIDRVIALAALGVLVVFTLPALGLLAGFNVMPVLLALLVAAMIGLWLLLNLDRLLEPFKHLRPVHWLLYFTGSLRLLLKHQTASVLSFVYAVIAHICMCLAGCVLAQSLHVDLTIMQSITLIPPVMLATTIPISIGGWGIREAGMVGMLSLAGVPKALALMISIQLGLVTIIVSLPAGLLWLAYRRHSHVHHP